MNKDIQNFISINRLKNGRIKISHDISNEANIYKMLYEMGFRQSKLNGKKIYYRRTEGKIQVTAIWEIRDEFYEFLEREQYQNCPIDISIDDVLNWFLRDNPIRQNGLFENNLKDNLSEVEEHLLRMSTDIEYKSDHQIKNTLTKLKDLEFESTVDVKGTFRKGNDLYFKQIGNEEYLVFNHFNKNLTLNSGFDAWRARFNNKEEIGIKNPKNIEQIKLSFEVERDFELVEEYLN